MKGLADVPQQPTARSRPEAPARIDGVQVTWEEIVPLMAEASGGLILREIALDRAVRAACDTRGITVDEAAIDAERTRLMESIERDAAAGAADSAVLLDSVRRNRGLGEARFARLLERNARMRALVAREIGVNDAEVRQAIQVRFGERYRIRVIVTTDEREAMQLKEELAKASSLDVAFARAAALKSTDPSAVRGGLLEPISPADQSYPETIRFLLPTLQAGQMSPVVAVDRGFAIALLDSVIAGVEPPPDASEAARAEIRVRKERIAMEDLARRLLAKMEVVPVDADVAWSWRMLNPSP
jgi:hypothetical protein